MQTFTASVELNKNDNSSLEQIFGHQKKKKKEDSRNYVCLNIDPFVKSTVPTSITDWLSSPFYSE